MISFINITFAIITTTLTYFIFKLSNVITKTADGDKNIDCYNKPLEIKEN